MLLWLMGVGSENFSTVSEMGNIPKVVPRLYEWL